MRLTKKNISHYLLDKGFLNASSFISGDYKLMQTQSRNSIFKIEQQYADGLFVKQLIAQDQQNSYLMQKDATSHYLIHYSDLFKETASYVPAYYGYDSNHHILVTEFYSNSKNVHELTYQKQEFSEDYAIKMAEILSSFHFDITKEIPKNKSLQFFNKLLPWILNLSNIKNNMGAPSGNAIITKIHQHPELVQKIEKVAELWENTSFIHGDIKWMNFIVTNENDKEELKLIDWEIADIGDPLWDVAGIFQSYLSAWVLSYQNQQINHHQKEESAKFVTLEGVQKMLKILWDTYAKKQKFSKKKAEEALYKTLAFAAVRMVQTGFENNMRGTELMSNSVRILQFSDHILEDPKVIAKQWNLID